MGCEAQLSAFPMITYKPSRSWSEWSSF